MIYKTYLSGRFCGTRVSYIYSIYSIKYKLCYIGQTNDSVGVIGRLTGHLCSNGTFRSYFENIVGIFLDDVDDLTIICSSLNDPNIFSTTSSSYREGVEYLVKKKLMEFMAKKNVFLRIVGDTRSISTTSLICVKNIADKIAEEMFLEIQSDYWG